MIDASIPLSVKNFNVQPAIDNYREAKKDAATEQMQAATLRDMQQQRDVRAEQLKAARLESAESVRMAHEANTLRGLAQVNDITTPEGQGQYLKDAQSLGFGHKIPEISQEFAKQAALKKKAQEDAIKAKRQEGIDRLDLRSRILPLATDEASYQNTLQRLKNLGDDLDGLEPTFNPNAVKGHIEEVLTLKERLEQAHKTAEDAGKAATLKETVRHNKETEKSDPNWDKLEGASGVYLYNKKTGQIKPATDAGKPIEPKPKPGEGLKQIPPTVNAAIIENTQNLSRAKSALSLVKGEKVAGAQGDSEAVGMKGYLPQDILNRWDPKGVETRAFISDLGSMILHDRSGAAVTAAESPRLKPFIPLATDDKNTARKKLERFVQIYEQENNAFAQVYNEATGYKPNPLLGKSGSGSSGSWGSPTTVKTDSGKEFTVEIEGQ